MIPMGLNRLWCCSALAGLSLWSQPAPQDVILDLMSAKLAAAYAMNRGPGQGGAFLLLTTIGIPITPAQTQDPYELSLLLDRIPLRTRQYNSGGRTFSSVFGTIIRTAEVTRFQKQSELNQLRLARNLLRDRLRPGKPSALYAAYLKYQHAYAVALDTQALAQVEQQTAGRPAPPGLDLAVARALSNWEAMGNKRVVEAAIATIMAACSTNPRVIINDLNDAMNIAAINDGHATPWFPVVSTPPMTEWLDSGGWQDWHFRKNDLRAEAPPARLPAADRSLPPLTPSQEAWHASVVMDAKLKRVDFTRPWLDLNLFRSHAWRLSPSSGLAVVSTGNPEDPEPGSMPLVVTGLLLARNLVLSGQWSGDGNLAEAPRALGPFALASPAPNRSLPLHPFISTFEGKLGIQVEGTQIIGFFCESVPKAPSPDPKLFR
jgi:hypothetical protein